LPLDFETSEFSVEFQAQALHMSASNQCELHLGRASSRSERSLVRPSGVGKRLIHSR